MEAYVGDDEEYGLMKDEDRVWYVIGDDEYGSDIDMPMSSDSDSDSEEIRLGDVDGGLWMIYPSLDLDHYSYRHAHILDFSKRSIANYNRDTGHSYEFVELVEAFVTQASKTDLVTTIFKACQPDDPSVTSFRARTYAPSRSLLDPNLDIKVVPLHYESHTSSTSTSTSEDKLKTQVELLQISS